MYASKFTVKDVRVTFTYTFPLNTPVGTVAFIFCTIASMSTITSKERIRALFLAIVANISSWTLWNLKKCKYYTGGMQKLRHYSSNIEFDFKPLFFHLMVNIFFSLAFFRFWSNGHVWMCCWHLDYLKPGKLFFKFRSVEWLRWNSCVRIEATQYDLESYYLHLTYF